MTPTIKAGLLATTMAAMALVPAAGLFTLASVDAAYAKGEGNGNGGGGGNGNGGERGNGNDGERGNGGRDSDARGGQSEARGGGKPDGAGDRGNRGGRSESARGGGDPVSNFLRGLTGEEKREARAQARAARHAPTEYAPEASVSPGKRPARNSDMHPSELGNMNGALNANMNAVLAHIRNQNFEGPVGAFAAIAIADAGFAEVDGDRVLNQETIARLLPAEYETVGAYQEAVENGAAEIPALDDAIAALGEDVNLTDPVASWRPDADAVQQAEDALAARTAAETALLDSWNKNADTDPELLTEAERQLLSDLRARLAGHETEIEGALTESQSRAAGEEDEAACGALAACETAEDGEDIAAVE